MLIKNETREYGQDALSDRLEFIYQNASVAAARFLRLRVMEAVQKLDLSKITNDQSFMLTLREARQSKGFTQTTLSDISKVNQSRISLHERRNLILSDQEKSRIEGVLGVQVNWGDR